jgi:hypothetical protein
MALLLALVNIFVSWFLNLFILITQKSPRPDRKNGINLIPSRYHWDQLDAKLIVLDIRGSSEGILTGKLISRTIILASS